MRISQGKWATSPPGASKLKTHGRQYALWMNHIKVAYKFYDRLAKCVPNNSMKQSWRCHALLWDWLAIWATVPCNSDGFRSMLLSFQNFQSLILCFPCPKTGCFLHFVYFGSTTKSPCFFLWQQKQGGPHTFYPQTACHMFVEQPVYVDSHSCKINILLGNLFLLININKRGVQSRLRWKI